MYAHARQANECAKVKAHIERTPLHAVHAPLVGGLRCELAELRLVLLRLPLVSHLSLDSPLFLFLAFLCIFRWMFFDVFI